jgi:cell division septation protein DedD
MENAIVRRGIGAVVLALIAALLLGYLLKGKGSQRKDVATMDLPPAPIQIFPGENTGAAGAAGANATGASGAAGGNAAGNANAGNAGGGTAGNSPQLLGESGAAMTAAGTQMAANTANTVRDAGKSAANTGKAAVNNGKAAASGAAQAAKDKFRITADKIIDPKSGNPHATSKSVTVDKAGQAVIGANDAAVKNSPGFSVRAPTKGEVRPSVDGPATLARRGSGSTQKKAPKAKLVNEKKLPSVGKRSAPTLARSEPKKPTPPKKPAAPKKPKPVTSGGSGKYVVQLLATSNAAKATGLRNTMKKEGYPAFISKTVQGGKTIYRVRIGSYNGKSAAIGTQGKMKRRYRQNPYVQGSIVVRN